MKTLVVGDIHGCYQEFQSLLEKAAIGKEDLIVSVGDCVDRGPDTPEVLKFFMENPNTRLIMGNHERKHVRGSRGEVKLARSQQISKIQFGKSYDEAIEFMSNLPLYLDLPDAFVAHGYFEPGFLPEQQNPLVLCGTMGGDKHMQKLYNRPWYELYDGAKPILVGHKNYTDTDQPFIYQDRAFGLDTDCVMGKSLTAILLPSFQIVSIPSRANHWMETQRLYPKPEKVPQPKPASVGWNDEHEKMLADLVVKVYAANAVILRELESEPGYAELRPRSQARLFGEKAGNGISATLLQLARTGKLNSDVARRIIKKQDLLPALHQQIERFLA